MTRENEIKMIFRNKIKEASAKKRDMTNNGSPVYGDRSAALAACLIDLEMEVEQDIKRLISGESIYDIVSGLENSDEYDKEIEETK